MFQPLPATSMSTLPSVAPSTASPPPAAWPPTDPPRAVALKPFRVRPERVMMLITPRNAFAPYSAEPGPRKISMRSTADIGTSSSPKKFPVLGR